MSRKVKLGEKYRDTISGFEGTATCRIEYLHGCVRVGLEREGATDKAEDREQFFDEQRLVTAKTGRTPEPTATSGGPRPKPPARTVPRR